MPTRNNEWLNENSLRAYPFKEGSTLKNGNVTIPKNFVVDAVLSGTSSSLRYRVNYIHVTQDYVQLGVADEDGTFHGVFNISTSVTDRYAVSAFQPEVTSSIRGKVIFGKGLQTVKTWTGGRFYFGFDQTELEPSLCIPAASPVSGVTSIAKYGSTNANQILTGDVQIKAGRGVDVSIDATTNAVTLSVLKDWNCNCPEDFNRLHPCRACIKTINGVRPRQDGNIDIMQGDWIYVVPHPADNRIEIGFVGDVDCCCDACAGLEDLKNQLAALAAAL